MTKHKAAKQVHKCQQTGIGHCNKRGWHVYTYHPSGIMWSEERRPLYPTKAEAIAAVLDEAAYQERTRHSS